MPRRAAPGKRRPGGMASSFQQRLQEKIQQLRAAERGFLPLEKAIRETFDLPPDHKGLLSRRQLQKIAEGEEIPLRLDQLDLLDRFLRHRRHESLADMLNPPSVLRYMAEEGRIGFIIGSQPNRELRRIDFSRWDIKSMQTIQECLYATGKPLQISFEDAILRGRQAEVFRDESTLPAHEDWFHMVGNLDSQGQTLIVVGSPRVNHGAEKVLAAMFGVEPFRPWPASRIKDRPFAFFWPDWCENPARPESCLHFDPVSDSRYVEFEQDDLEFLRSLGSRDAGSQQAEERRYDCGMVANGRFHRIRRGQKKWSSYAVIAARRGLHRTCACICGATGPATLAAARIFERFVPELGWRDHRVAWCLVRADVRDERQDGVPGFRADERRVVDQVIVDDKIHFYEAPRR